MGTQETTPAGNGGEGTPAADAPQGGSEPDGAHTADPPGSTPGPATTDGQGAPPAEGGEPQAAAGKNGKAKEPPAAEPAKPGPNLTARLAEMSRDNRTVRKELRQKAEALEAASKRVADFDGLIRRAQSGDDTVIDELYNRFGLNFERIVNYHAGKPDPTPEQAQKEEIAALRKRLDDDAAARQREKEEADARAAASRDAAARAEFVGMAAQRIKAAPDKFEICARLGDEAAEAIFQRVVKAWGEAGNPQLMPGELEEAMDAAAEVQELEYEKRGQMLIKKAANGAATNGTNGHATGKAPKSSELPANLTGGKLSDTDEQILNGLIDKTAPGATSQRAKPRTINSGLGGSAPPKSQPRGSMDARDALRDTLERNGLIAR